MEVQCLLCILEFLLKLELGWVTESQSYEQACTEELASHW